MKRKTIRRFLNRHAWKIADDKVHSAKPTRLMKYSETLIKKDRKLAKKEKQHAVSH